MFTFVVVVVVEATTSFVVVVVVVLVEGFVLSVCPEIWLRIPSLSICFLRICMINLAMCMLQLR